HAYHAAQVDRILGTIGRPARALRNRCDDYAGDVLGWRGYAPWLYVFTSTQGVFRDGWIPDNYYGCVVVPRINGESGLVSRLKTLSARVLSIPPHVPVLPDAGYVVNGVFTLRSGRV